MKLNRSVDSILDSKKFALLAKPHNCRSVFEAAFKIREASKHVYVNGMTPYRQELIAFVEHALKVLETQGMKKYVTEVFNPLALALYEYTVKPPTWADNDKADNPSVSLVNYDPDTGSGVIWNQKQAASFAKTKVDLIRLYPIESSSD